MEKSSQKSCTVESAYMQTGYMQKPAICKDSLGSHYYILHCFESGYMQKPDICKNFAGSRAFACTRILLYLNPAAMAQVPKKTFYTGTTGTQKLIAKPKKN